MKAMVDNPQDRGAAAAQAAESLGCKLHGLWWGLGDHDGVFILEAPDNVSVVALAMAVGASGQISTETTLLLEMDEAQEAMRRAARVKFHAPS
ncbi:MAG: GYD domain-containing protein [Solirubrobacterales bacterium]|nr:GYD domain-containing protein [Solirubrobacterales bacterium]